MKRIHMVGLVFVVLVLLLIGSVSSTIPDGNGELYNVTIYLLSANSLPIGNANVTLRDHTDNTTIDSNLTSNDSGSVFFEQINITVYDEINFNILYPSSSYTAQLINISCPSFVYLNEFGGITVIVTNTLGEYLEAQDGRIYVTEAADTSVIVKEYNTQCKTDEPYLDGDGNWASYSDCPLSDSMGRYVYKFDVLEKDGYEFNQNYTIHAVINAVESTCNFTTILPKHADTDKYEAMAKRWSGLVSIFIFILLMGMIILYPWKRR